MNFFLSKMKIEKIFFTKFLLIQYFLVLSLFSKYNIDWPQPAVFFVLSAFSFANFNIDLVGIECYGPK